MSGDALEKPWTGMLPVSPVDPEWVPADNDHSGASDTGFPYAPYLPHDLTLYGQFFTFIYIILKSSFGFFSSTIKHIAPRSFREAHKRNWGRRKVVLKRLG